MKLYCAPRTCSVAACIALTESGIPFEPERVDFSDVQSVAGLRRLNPAGYVPVLVDRHQVLTETVAIMWFAAETAPESGLLPRATAERAQCLAWLSWCASSVHVAFRQLRKPQRFSNGPENTLGPIRAHGRSVFLAALKRFDRHLADRTFMLGERFSLADIYPVVFSDWSRLADLQVAGFARLAAHVQRVTSRPAVRRALDLTGTPAFGDTGQRAGAPT